MFRGKEIIRRSKMAKDLDSLKWIERLLPEGYIRKHMFGGFGYYLNEKMILAMFENFGDRSYKDQAYDFDIWNGCLFPAERESHQEIKKKFPILISHPVLPKWLYLPSQTEDFDSHAENILKEIRRQSKLFGVIPKPKKTKNVKSKKSSVKRDAASDMRRPRMFRDEPVEERLTSAKKISDLKNLGPASEKEFAKAGIKSAGQFIKMGWKKALIKLVKSNPKNRHSLFAYALIGALTNKEWNGLSEAEKKEAREFTNSLKPQKKK